MLPGYAVQTHNNNNSPGKNDFLVFRQLSKLIKCAIFDGGGGILERSRSKVELTLLKRHEAGSCEDAMSARQKLWRFSVKQIATNYQPQLQDMLIFGNFVL